MRLDLNLEINFRPSDGESVITIKNTYDVDSGIFFYNTLNHSLKIKPDEEIILFLNSIISDPRREEYGELLLFSFCILSIIQYNGLYLKDSETITTILFFLKKASESNNLEKFIDNHTPESLKIFNWSSLHGDKFTATFRIFDDIKCGYDLSIKRGMFRKHKKLISSGYYKTTILLLLKHLVKKHKNSKGYIQALKSVMRECMYLSLDPSFFQINLTSYRDDNLSEVRMLLCILTSISECPEYLEKTEDSDKLKNK